MKIITEKGLSKIEDLLNGSIVSNVLNLDIKVFYNKEEAQKNDRLLLFNKGIIAKKTGMYLSFPQEDLQSEFEEHFEELNVWIGGKSRVAVLASTMEHQRLSNCINLLDILLSKGEIAQSEADNYMKELNEVIVPELERRFAGELLPYVPYYQWEKALLLKPNIISV